MQDGIAGLTDREKATLRLLVQGHDAKSAARQLDLSVHTVNERLRDARRKLSVSSSREAARLLAQAERENPDFLVNKPFKVSDPTGGMHLSDKAPEPRWVAGRSAWLIGGIVTMSLLLASMLLLSPPTDEAQPVTRSETFAIADAIQPDPAVTEASREWLALIDRQDWEQSWRSAATTFRTAVTSQDWTASVIAARGATGPVQQRILTAATMTASLPGMPSGEYQALQFATDFDQKADAVESLFLTREGAEWKVIGYFIR